MKSFSELQESLKNKKDQGDKDPCWKGYQQVGMKKKNGKEVPNCVPKEEVEESSKAYGKSQQKILDKKKKDSISSSDKEKLVKLKKMMSKESSVDEKFKVSYKDTGTYTVAFRNKNGKIEAEVLAKSKESAEKQVAIRNKKVKSTDGKWEVIKTGKGN